MRIRSLLIVLLIVALTVSLNACGGKLPVEGLPTTPQGGDGADAPATQAAPATTAAPEPTLPQPKGVDSVKTLLEISLDYFHSGCDYSKIAEYHDPRAYLAYFLMEDFYDEEEMSLDQAMEKAALFYGSAEELQEKDPWLAEQVMEELDAMDPEEALNEYMTGLRDSFRNGEITEDNPNYEKLSAILADWDKGADYVFEHYPELLQSARDRGMVFGLQDAMEQMQRFGRFELYRSTEEDEKFRDLECEYRPENTYVDPSGICSYDMGYVVEGYDAWSVDMMYYVRDGLYYLLGYSYAVGSVGG